jgi:broad specificity phosphatase PhoE
MMRFLDHRRHSLRDPASPHLSAAGLALAHRVASTIGPFDRVVTSPKPRAVETAVAMGYAVAAELEELSTVPSKVQTLIDALQPRTFADYAALVGRNPVMARYARGQEALWRHELDGMPDGGRLLIVSHGGVIESGAVIAAPASAGGWGPTLDYLEGIRLYREGGRWVRAEVARVGP